MARGLSLKTIRILRTTCAAGITAGFRLLLPVPLFFGGSFFLFPPAPFFFELPALLFALEFEVFSHSAGCDRDGYVDNRLPVARTCFVLISIDHGDLAFDEGIVPIDFLS